MRERCYIETTIPSYLTARPSRDLVVQARQHLTREWWETQASRYDCYVSYAVLAEVAEGDPRASDLRLESLEGLPILELTEEADQLACTILKTIQVPTRASEDALHIALASVNAIDYLVTWNFKHLVNPANFKKLRAICEKAGYQLPEICTPEELLESRRGI